jgi:excisionase family DNA binding protein
MGMNTPVWAGFAPHRVFANCSRVFLNFPYNSRPRLIPGSLMDDEILTIREVAELLKINEKTAYRLAAESKLPGFRVGGSWRFKKSTIDAWIDAQSVSIRGSSKKVRGQKLAVRVRGVLQND